MQNKGAIKLFAILLALACLFYLSFTWVTRNIEAEAAAYGKTYSESAAIQQAVSKLDAKDSTVKRAFIDSVQIAATESYLDSLKKKTVYDIFITKYTYEECKQKEINLGLDLRGGMNVTLEVSVADIIKGLTNNNPDAAFNKAIAETQKNLGIKNNKDFVDLFADMYRQTAPNGRLAPLFQTIENKGKIDFNASNEQVITFIRERVDEAVNNSEKTFRSRIDRFGVAQPNIQKLEASGRILIELPGVKEKERVRKLLQGTANLEFWETYENAEVAPYFDAANKKIKSILAGGNDDKADSLKTQDSLKTAAAAAAKAKMTPAELKKAKEDSVAQAALAKAKADSAKANLSLAEKISAEKKNDTTAKKGEKQDTSLASYKLNNPLFSMAGPLQPAIYNDGKQQFFSPGATVGYARIKDTSEVNSWLNNPKVRSAFPSKIRFMWAAKPEKESDVLMLFGIKMTDRNGKPALYGDIIADARKDFDQKTGEVTINMNMTGEAAQTWKKLTASNAPKKQGERGHCIAIVMDNLVYSAPTVNGEIPTGNSSISGNFDNKEADALVAILSAGKLPAPAKIVEESVVGPTLGQEAISSGLTSFIIAFIVILIFMALYYNKAGWVANLALFINVFFIMGILTSLGAVLTLPGIAGIVLTIGLSVDANILIFERIREELALGKAIGQAIKEGFRHAMSSIIDSNITLLILGIILYAFGSGPVQGFATTLCIGILSSLFAAVLLSRVIFETMLGRKMNITFDNSMTRNSFKNVAIDFVKRRKTYYAISAAIIVLGIVFYFKNGGFNLGVDFKGGRTYTVRFEKDMNTDDVKAALSKVLDGN
ncbi:MAG: protein translocase subunit SecD, partial [Bacteroidia bacterium]